jgi:hypothetical protein
MRSLFRAALPLGLLALAAAPAQAATLSTSKAHARSCHAKVYRSADQLRVTAPSNGLVKARLKAPAGDWDLAVFDARTGRSVAAAAGFASDELAEGFVTKGQRLIVQGCRFRGAASDAGVRVGFVAAGGSAGKARASAARGAVQVVDVQVASNAEKRRLQSLGLDLTEHGDANSIEVVLWGSADADKLRANKFRYTVRVADLTARNAANAKADEAYAAATAQSGLPSGRDSYRRLADYDLELKQLAMQYPSLVKPITLNHKSWEGRPVNGIEITKNAAAADGKPIFLMMGVHHAREWPSSEHTLEFAYDLLRNYGSQARTTGLVDRTRTIIVPIVNPDGFNVSREARSVTNPNLEFTAQDYEMKRKNCRDAVNKCNQVSRLQGVDPNRNYGGLWGGSGASPNPGSDVYRGPGPFSEPEVKNVKELVGARQVVTLITNHTYSNLILRSPGTVAQRFPLEEDAQRALGARMASHNGYANVPGFGLYDTTGGTEDWTFWTAGALSYTFEIGGTDFHPPFEQGVVDEYLGRGGSPGAGKGGNREAYYEALLSTADAGLHSVLEGSAPAGSQLKISKSFNTRTSDICRDEFCVFTNPAFTFPDTLSSSMTTTGSKFAFHVNPSTRPDVAGRSGRNPEGAPQPSIALANPAGFPAENVNYPVPDTGAQERIPFTVQPRANGVDNGRFTVHIEWADPGNDWDVYVLGPDGTIATQSAAYGDATEDAVLLDPPAGQYTAVVINYDQVTRQPDEWTGNVTFASPEPAWFGPKEAWTLTCKPPTGASKSRQVTVDRGQTVNVGNACK